MSDPYSKSPTSHPSEERRHARCLQEMVERTIEARGIRDQRILDALLRVPRHAFVPPEFVNAAYDDSPLPVGNGQTISQPYIVALMTEAAAPEASHRCLEVGTGCGYQTAVLSLLCGDLYSIECIAQLASQARANLAATGFLTAAIHLMHGDGYFGWPDAAPFDVILVTAAPPRIPKPLLDQLAIGGRLIVPVGPAGSIQQLERWTRRGPGDGPSAFDAATLLDVRFVPMVGAAQER